MFYTGWLFKELFRSLPDTQSAQISASNLLGLFDEAPKINTLSSYGLDPKVRSTMSMCNHTTSVLNNKNIIIINKQSCTPLI